jgi:O-antigen/teichoic acid export membrane protein
MVARNFFALGAGEIAARLIAFAATAYAARTLGASTYGVIGFAAAVFLYLNRVADFGIELSGARDLARDRNQIRNLASSVLIFRLMIATILVALTSAVAFAVLPYPDSIVLAIYSLALIPVAASTRWIFIGMEESSVVAVARIVGELAMASLIFLLIRIPADIAKVPIAQVVGDSIAAILLIIWLRRRGQRFSLRFDWPAVRPLFRRAWPLVLSALLGLIIYNSGMIFLRAMRGTEDVGYFAAAYMLISFLVNLGLSYRMSLLPTMTRLGHGTPERNALYRSAFAHVFALAVPIALGGFQLAPQIVQLIFGDGYAASVPALQLLILSVPLCLLRDVPSAVMLADAREDQFFRMTAWGAGINLTLNMVLIPRYGMIGAAAATVITEAVRLVLAFGYVRAQRFERRDVAACARVILAAAAMGALLAFANPGVLWLALLLGTAGYFLALVLFGGVRWRRGGLPALNV